MRYLLPLLLIACLACGGAARSSSTYAYRTAPNPNGCYVEVFAEAQFKGTRDFVNGPSRYPRVSNIRSGKEREDGIRSVRSGPAAIVTVWSEEAYRGSLLRLGPDQESAKLLDALGSKGVSLQVACSQVAAE